MQVVGGDAIPTAFREGQTERIIERRNWQRRTPRRRDDVAAPLVAAPASRKKVVIAVSLATFACGVLAATAFYRLRPKARAEGIAQIERAQPPAPASSAPQQTAPAAPAMIVAPVATPEPVVSPAPTASAPAAAESHPEKRLTQPKARPATRGPVARAARPRRTAPPVSARAPAIEAAGKTPSVAPRPKKKWVDPFAE
jgi:hypothetical protein